MTKQSEFQEVKSGQPIIIQQNKMKSNGIGTAGFIFALISLFIGWIPVLGVIGWALGFIFSFFGIFKKPRGLAIAGLVISITVFILLFKVISITVFILFFKLMELMGINI